MLGSQILKAHLALLLVNLLYGANHVLAKGVMPQYLDPNTFILLRVSGAVLLFWILLFTQKRKPVDRSDYWRFAAAGLFGVAVNQLFFFHGLNLSSALNAGIIMALNPLMVFILAAVITKEKLSAHNYTGIFIGAAGAILLTLSSGKLPGASPIGDVFLLINALSYALYLVLSKPLLLKYSPIQVITYVFSIGLLLLLLFPPTWSHLSAGQCLVQNQLCNCWCHFSDLFAFHFCTKIRECNSFGRLYLYPACHGHVFYGALCHARLGCRLHSYHYFRTHSLHVVYFYRRIFSLFS